MKTEKVIKDKLKQLQKDFRENIDDSETTTMIFGALEILRWVLED